MLSNEKKREKKERHVFLSVSCFSPGMHGICPMREGGLRALFILMTPGMTLVQERADSLSENDGWSIMCGPSCVIYRKVVIFVLLR